ncbi:MAG TPA: hypothetical protein PKC47_01715, partial [Petrimonas sp.]|nr:hypothetical protein [Petrimonas sp.]
MKKEIFFRVPENLFVESLVSEEKVLFTERKLRIPNLYYILDQLVDAGCSQHKRMEEDNSDFVYLNAMCLKNVVHNYEDYISFLLDTKVLQTDNQYIIGEKSKGYCYSIPYSGMPLKQVSIIDYKLSKAIRKNNRQLSEKVALETRGYNFLTKWFKSNKLQINVIKAMDWVKKHIKDEMEKLNQSSSKHKNALIRLRNKEQLQLQLVQTFNKKNDVGRRKGDGERFYSKISNLKRELREFLTYDNLKLVEIDLKSSQPFLSLCLLDINFWNSEKTNKKSLKWNLLGNKIKEIIKGENKNNNIINNIIMLLKTSESLIGKWIQSDTYKKVVQSGKLYEEIQQKCSIEFPSQFNSREKSKRNLLTMLYSN